MAKVIGKRLLSIIFVLWAVATLTYFMVHVTPGDTASAIVASVYGPEFIDENTLARVTEKYDLDRPIISQYFDWLKNAVCFNFGTSYRYNMPVKDIMLMRLPNTLKLGFTAFLISTLIGIPLGIWTAYRQNRFIDHFTRVSTLTLSSFPGFWVALVLIIIFAYNLKLFPTSGMDTPNSIVLPAVTLSVGMLASTTRLMRASMIEVLRQDYMLTAKSKGIKKASVGFHAFRNAVPTIITVLGLQIGHILGGSVLVESVFAWPGLGGLFNDAVAAKDLPLMEGCVILVTFGYAFANLLVDILYAAVDPRVKYQEVS